MKQNVKRYIEETNNRNCTRKRFEMYAEQGIFYAEFITAQKAKNF